MSTTRVADGALIIARYTWDPYQYREPEYREDHPDDSALGCANHNGGMLAFGPSNRMLYIGTGDGGGGDDQFHNGQNLNSLLAKILRIDVHPQNPTNAVPTCRADNPFVRWRAGAP